MIEILNEPIFRLVFTCTKILPYGIISASDLERFKTE